MKRKRLRDMREVHQLLCDRQTSELQKLTQRPLKWSFDVDRHEPSTINIFTVVIYSV